jgi:hypothetical protein
MKTESHSSLTPRYVLLYLLAYALWLTTTAACAMAVIQFRSTVSVLWIVNGGDRYSLGFVNQAVFLLGGLIAFVYVILLESHYREGKSPRCIKSLRCIQTGALAG